MMGDRWFGNEMFVLGLVWLRILGGGVGRVWDDELDRVVEEKYIEV